MVKWSNGLCILVFSFLKLEFNFGGEHNCDFNTKYEITVYHTVSVSGTYIQFSKKNLFLRNLRYGWRTSQWFHHRILIYVWQINIPVTYCSLGPTP